MTFQGCRSRTNGGKSRNENGNRVKKSTPKGYEHVRLCRLGGMIA